MLNQINSDIDSHELTSTLFVTEKYILFLIFLTNKSKSLHKSQTVCTIFTAQLHF